MRVFSGARATPRCAVHLRQLWRPGVAVRRCSSGRYGRAQWKRTSETSTCCPIQPESEERVEGGLVHTIISDIYIYCKETCHAETKAYTGRRTDRHACHVPIVSGSRNSNSTVQMFWLGHHWSCAASNHTFSGLEKKNASHETSGFHRQVVLFWATISSNLQQLHSLCNQSCFLVLQSPK